MQVRRKRPLWLRILVDVDMRRKCGLMDLAFRPKNLIGTLSQISEGQILWQCKHVHALTDTRIMFHLPSICRIARSHFDAR